MQVVERAPVRDESIGWKPSAKQSEFLAAGENEVLYGGAAGGGKSDAILIDALGLHQNAVAKRGYQAIIFRRSYPELKDLIDRSLELYPLLNKGVHYEKLEHVWRWPSGARLEFGHIQRDVDRFKYRGRAFQYIGWDELTLWPTPVPYTYLMSRLRSVDRSIELAARSTTNPEGPGFKWVKERFRIPRTGTGTCFQVRVRDDDTGETRFRWRRFIPARLKDNPYLAETDYKTELMLMAEEERNALLLGLWDTPQIRGAYYTGLIEKARAEKRITKVPILKSVPVNTFWDLGWNDTTAIWFHQRVGLENRFIDCYENSGEPMSHYVKVLHDKAKEHGIIYEKHYLPHDGEHKHMATGLSPADVMRSMSVKSIEIVKQIPDILDGINLVREQFPSYWFDEDRCAEGVAAVENYRKERNEKTDSWKAHPLHDWASNYADALRQHAQGYRTAAPSAYIPPAAPPRRF